MKQIQRRTFPTAVVLSLSSGRLLCEFGDMQALADFMTGSSVFTHQFAHQPFVDELANAIFRQYPALRDFNAAAITRDNWKTPLADAIARYGPTLELHPMGEPEHFADAFTEPLVGKRVIAVKA